MYFSSNKRLPQINFSNRKIKHMKPVRSTEDLHKVKAIEMPR